MTAFAFLCQMDMPWDSSLDIPGSRMLVDSAGLRSPRARTAAYKQRRAKHKAHNGTCVIHLGYNLLM